eukprot:tig00000842_g4876.t1
MEKYRRVEKPKQEQSIEENEIRITTQGKMRNYISYATNLFQGEKNANEVVLKAMGRAINKTVTIAEIIKRRIPGLHQLTKIDSTDITDVWEPIEEGLNKLETTRHVSMVTITLSKLQLDSSLPGYQPPIPEDQVKPLQEEDFGEYDEARPARGRGRGRGAGPAGRGRGRGRGRGGAAAGGEVVESAAPVEAEGARARARARSWPRARARSWPWSRRGPGWRGEAHPGTMLVPDQGFAGAEGAPAGAAGAGVAAAAAAAVAAGVAVRRVATLRRLRSNL